MRSRIDRERWPEVERIYHETIGQPVGERHDFLSRACGADAALRDEIASLLSVDTGAGAFLERPAAEITAPWRATRRTPLEPGQPIGDYVLGPLLGSGGMGEVYSARDVKLDREVALKILEYLPDDPAGARAVEDEARAASALAHPNIVTIYAVGHAGPHGFIAMELVPGSTLRERLAGSPVEPDEALDIATQLAAALSAAHEAAILHRDLKPENVMITASGLVKVLDFGIARRPPGGAAGTAPDRPALIAGTPGYMAPEQASGRPADHRSDQFSFGAVVHEMLTRDVPPADHVVNDPRIPAPVRPILERCLRADPDARYASTRDLAVRVRHVKREREVASARGGVSRRRLIRLGGAAAAGLVGAASWRILAGVPAIRSLAVLPFGNGDGDPAIDYLCDGLTDVLIRRLAFVPDLDVRARTAVFNFKTSSLAPAEAARQLGVDAALSGTITARGGRLSVTASLIDVPSGVATWTDRYDRELADTLSLPHDLARAIIGDAMRRPLAAADRRRVEREPTRNARAHDFYLRGVYALRAGGLANYLDARRFLGAAVREDPSFALAYVPLASTYTILAVEGLERPTEAWPRSNRLTRRALEIDPDLADAHAELASSWFFFDHDWAGAETAWKRAMAADGPVEPDLYAATALKLFALGRTADALAAAARARSLDPLTPKFAVQQADLLWHAGRAEEATGTYAEVLASRPDSADAWLGLAAVQRATGRIGEAIAARRRASALLAAPREVRQALAGATSDADLQLADRLALEASIRDHAERARRGEYVSPLDLARAYAELGDADRAFAHLDAAFADWSPGIVFLNVDRAWSGLRQDARFAAAIAALGLPQQGASS